MQREPDAEDEEQFYVGLTFAYKMCYSTFAAAMAEQ